MAKWVKKKFNVGLFIVLLLCAFVPGIIYGIYCAIPARISENKPKRSGWIGALVGSAINVLVWVYWIIYVINSEGDEVPQIFYFNIAFAATLLVLVLLNKKGRSTFLTFVSMLVVLVNIILDVINLYYGWIGLIAIIVALVCLFKMHKYHKYQTYGTKVEEETEEVVEVSEEKETE